MATGDLLPNENYWYTSAANRAKQNYALGSAQNSYERMLAGQGAAWDQQDLARQYKIAAQKFSAPWVQRGMFNSGLRQQAAGQFEDDKLRALARQQQSWNLKNQGYDLTEQQLAQARDNALWDIQAQKDAQRRTIAATYTGSQ